MSAERITGGIDNVDKFEAYQSDFYPFYPNDLYQNI